MPGSDQKINYQIRPSKSAERKMMCELVKQIQIIRGIDSLRYVGMGAKYFTDFLLFHNEFGVSDMISIEAESERAMRYDFNKPLKSIQMIYGTTNDVLPQIQGFENKMNLVWLDYDSLFSKEMLYDVETLCRNLYNGSMFFISCNYFFKGKFTSEKMSAFKESVQDFFDESIDQRMYTNKNMPKIIRKIFDQQVTDTLDKRNRINHENKLDYLQLLFLTYSDGAPMLTLGGIIVDEKLKADIIQTKLENKLAFISNDEEPFKIEIPKLTYKEIQFILRQIPVSDEEYEANKEDFHGIELDEIRKFEKIYRYYPYYMEGQLNT